MNRNGDLLLYLGVGPIAAVLLGVALVPLRDLTVASNLAFVFLALTITVGALGGRGAALATALASALSLDFFLTRPYMRLAIHGKDDVIAFLGLSACGLLAAALGSPRREWREVTRQVHLLHGVLGQLERGSPPEHRLQELIAAARPAFPLSALALRGGDEQLRAAAGDGSLVGHSPGRVASPDAIATSGRLLDFRRGVPLPEDGLRVPLVVGGRPLGFLDMWGNGQPANREARSGLTALAHALAALLASLERVEPSAPPEPAWVIGQRKPRE
jgi:hypothetical protein